MTHSKSTPETLLEAISTQLGLSYEEQDWGIINADGDRVADFVRYLAQHSLEPTQRFELAGLILASVNERLLARGDVDVELLTESIRSFPQAYAWHIEYWCGLRDHLQFPAARLLRELCL